MVGHPCLPVPPPKVGQGNRGLLAPHQGHIESPTLPPLLTPCRAWCCPWLLLWAAGCCWAGCLPRAGCRLHEPRWSPPPSASCSQLGAPGRRGHPHGGKDGPMEEGMAPWRRGWPCCREDCCWAGARQSCPSSLAARGPSSQRCWAHSLALSSWYRANFQIHVRSVQDPKATPRP